MILLASMEKRKMGATTLSMTIFSIMTFSITTLGIMGLFATLGIAILPLSLC